MLQKWVPEKIRFWPYSKKISHSIFWGKMLFLRQFMPEPINPQSLLIFLARSSGVSPSGKYQQTPVFAYEWPFLAISGHILAPVAHLMPRLSQKSKGKWCLFRFLISHSSFNFWPKKQPYMPPNDKFGQLFALRPIWYFMLANCLAFGSSTRANSIYVVKNKQPNIAHRGKKPRA